MNLVEWTTTDSIGKKQNPIFFEKHKALMSFICFLGYLGLLPVGRLLIYISS